MNIFDTYNALAGNTLTRAEVKQLAQKAALQSKEIASKLNGILEQYQDKKKFEFENVKPIYEDFKGLGLPYFEHKEAALHEDENTGLNKRLDADSIYDMITERMIDKIDRATGLDYEKKWREKGYLFPYNFDTKKRYNGANMVLLLPNPLGLMENPFFMSFKQIEKHGGKLKKGSVSEKGIYYTILYKYKQDEPKLDYGTYDKDKFVKWAKANKSKIKIFKDTGDFNGYIGSFLQNATIPIPKYFNVFNGKDIEGIDFDLDNFKKGFVDNELQNSGEIIDNAEAIVDNYPAPKPKIVHIDKEGAYYTTAGDKVNMPPIKDFATNIDYYRVLFHELIHSTGNANRLKRKIANKFGTADYAKEELIAEFGAVYLSAEAGFMWHTNKNHEEYLKSWKNTKAQLQKDNRLLLKSASMAQKATDYILNLDADGKPMYLKDIANKPKKPQSSKESPKLSSSPIEVSKNKNTKKTNTSNKGLNGTAQNADTVAFNKLILKYQRKGKASSGDLIYLGKVDSILKKHIGGSKMYMLGSVINKAMNKDKDHSAEWHHFINLPDKINEPLIIFRSKSVGHVVVTELKNKREKPLLVAIHFNNRFKITQVKSIYSKRSLNTYKKWEKEGLLIYKNKKNALVGSIFAPIAKASTRTHSKYTKKTNTNKKGLNGTTQIVPKKVQDIEVIEPQIIKPIEPIVPATTPTQTVVNQEVTVNKPIRPKRIASGLVKPINQVSKVNSNFIIGGDIGAFLGNVEVKPIGSVACTIDAPQGSGKTRFFFQVLNEMAKNYKCLFISLEEHPESTLFQSKVQQYIEPANQQNIDAIGEITKGKEKQTLNDLVPNYDVIFVDSWNKIFESSKLDFDNDLRKAYNGKLIFAIFQRTVTGSMRGGSKAQFDGDIIMKIDKGEDFKENQVRHDKNRYQDKDLTQLFYNIYYQNVTGAEPNPTETSQTPIAPVMPKPKQKQFFWDDAVVELNN